MFPSDLFFMILHEKSLDLAYLLPSSACHPPSTSMGSGSVVSPAGTKGLSRLKVTFRIWLGKPDDGMENLGCVQLRRAGHRILLYWPT